MVVMSKFINLKHFSTTLFIIAGLLFTYAPSAGALEKGVMAPDFTLTNLSGKKVKLSSYRGKVVLVNFWATWCYPCSMEVPSMEALYKKMKKMKFEILGVKIKDKPFGKKFIDENSLGFPVLIDDTDIALQYGITGVPETYIIDKKGRIAEKVVGSVNWDDEDVITYLKKLMSQK